MTLYNRAAGRPPTQTRGAMRRRSNGGRQEWYSASIGAIHPVVKYTRVIAS